MNPKDKISQKKANLSLIPGPSRIAIAEALMDGAEKYGPYNWRDEKIQVMTYLSACERHLAAYRDGENYASDSKIPHLAHAAATLCILLDAIACGKIIDNRPTPAPTGTMLDNFGVDKNDL